MVIACQPDVVWRAILADYVEAHKFKELGVVSQFEI
jgi:hypothetical protein